MRRQDRHLRPLIVVSTSFLALFCVVALSPRPANAAEISMLSGIFKNESKKNDGENGGGASEFNVGLQYGEEIQPKFHWFGEGLVEVNSYSAAKGGAAPDNSVGLTVGGGVRYEFEPFSHSIIPFARAKADYASYKTATINSTGYTSEETSGIFYYGGVGVRFGVEKQYFLDLETQLFNTALFAVTKSESAVVDAGGNKTTQKTSSTKVGLFADSRGVIGNAIVSIGMKL